MWPVLYKKICLFVSINKTVISSVSFWNTEKKSTVNFVVKIALGHLSICDEDMIWIIHLVTKAHDAYILCLEYTGWPISQLALAVCRLSLIHI